MMESQTFSAWSDLKCKVRSAFGPRISRAAVDRAAQDLAKIQRPGDALTLTRDDLETCRDAYHEFTAWCRTQGLDADRARVRLFCGDREQHQTPRGQVLATYADAHRGELAVFRAFDPVWVAARGRSLVFEVSGGDIARTYVFRGRAGYFFAGRLVWR